ncbi:MAG: tetratricopeptide repeat protein, partial [Nitrospirae bacterium]|nr:tetratricopeptide repeat protein [Nitrospirota bacterium]
MDEDIMGKDFYKNNKLTGVVLSVIMLLIVSDTYASYREFDLFDQGYEYYLSYQPVKAVETFNIFLREFPDSSAKDAAMFWLGKSLVQIRSLGEAKKVFSEIKREFPDSPFKQYANTELEAISKLETQAGVIADKPEIVSDLLGSNKGVIEIMEEGDKNQMEGHAAIKEGEEEVEDWMKEYIEEVQKLEESKKTVESTLKEKDERLKVIAVEKKELEAKLQALMVEKKVWEAKLKEVDEKMKAVSADDEELKDFYEKNKACLFLQPEEMALESLIIRYSKADENERAILALEIQ